MGIMKYIYLWLEQQILLKNTISCFNPIFETVFFLSSNKIPLLYQEIDSISLFFRKFFIDDTKILIFKNSKQTAKK